MRSIELTPSHRGEGPPPPKGAAHGGPFAGTGDKPVALVVEDDALFRFTLTEMLNERGYRCVEASNGAEGMMQFLAHKHEITLAVIDLNLPRGILGHEVCRFVRSAVPEGRRRPAIVAMTGDAQLMDSDSRVRAGVDQILRKPFLDAELGLAVNKARSGS